MKKRMITTFGLLILSLLLVTTTGTQASEKKVKPGEFYKGKKVKFIIPTRVGDTNDLIGRSIAPRFSELTDASVIISNRKGAGGLEGYVQVYRAKPNGLTIGINGMSLVIALNKIMGEPGAQYEPEKFGYISGINRERAVFCVNAEGPYRSIADLKAAKNIILGGTTPAGNISLGGMSIIRILDLNAKIVTGIKGISALTLSIQQGQSAGAVFPIGAALKRIKAKQLKPLFIIGSERVTPLPDVKAITELVNLKGEELELLKIWDELLFQSRLFFLPPEVPDDILIFLRKVFTGILNEPEYRKRINEIIGYEYEILTGNDLAKSLDTLAKKQDGIRHLFEGLIKQYRK